MSEFRRWDWIKRVLNAVTASLEPYGFRHAPEFDWESDNRDPGSYDWRETQWHRDRDWKVDVVRVLHTVQSLSHVQTGVRVCIHCPKYPLNESRLNGCGKEDYLVPLELVLKVLPRKLIRRICGDVIKSLSWFEQYSTPAQCLVALKAGRTNWGDTRGPIVLALQARLNELIDPEGVEEGVRPRRPAC